MVLHPIRHRNHGVGGENTKTTGGQVPVSEIFLSVQGEGVHAGTPSVFVRTYYCNLTCSWCDTKYTWLNQAASQPEVDYHLMTAEEILEEVRKYACNHVVLTGGEPLLHQDLLVPVLSSLKRTHFIEVETNGTITPTAEIIRLVGCFNVSPKTSNSGVTQRARVRRTALQAFAESGKAWFKFVVRERKDLDEIEALMSSLVLPRERVILMPEGTDRATLLDRGEWLAEICKQRGLRFTPRLQILLYGNRRGT